MYRVEDQQDDVVAAVERRLACAQFASPAFAAAGADAAVGAVASVVAAGVGSAGAFDAGAG
ncbi:hypothetical protein, partial [Ralstonia pseudosolanacearum]